MIALAPFVERRSRDRLCNTHLRRRRDTIPSALRSERRSRPTNGFDVALALEFQLDRYPTSSAMLAFIESQAYSAESHLAEPAGATYVEQLHQAAEVVRASGSAHEAVATLQGYQRYVAARS